MVFKISPVIIIISIGIGLQSCWLFQRPFDMNVKYSQLILNQSGQDIILKIFGKSDNRVQHIGLDSCWLMRERPYSEDVNPFVEMNHLDSIVMCSAEDNILKVWRNSEKTQKGKQFFNEDFWEKKEWEEGKYIYREWTFEILPEDIHLLKD